MASSPAHRLASEHAHHAGAKPPVAPSRCRPPSAADDSAAALAPSATARSGCAACLTPPRTRPAMHDVA
eukprot:4989620-Prymnesium_polylepis.1